MRTKHRGRFEGCRSSKSCRRRRGRREAGDLRALAPVQRGVRREVITPLNVPQAFMAQATQDREERTAARDTALPRALGLAHHWQRLLAEQRVASVADIAKAKGLDTSQVHRLMQPTLLAPEVVERLVNIPDLPVKRLLGRPWPYGWADQARVLDAIC